MDSAKREAIAARVLERSGADETEALVFSESSALSRFTHNEIHQNVASENVTINVRAIVGRRTGVASTDRLDDASLDATLHRALEMAELAPDDPALAPLTRGGPTLAPVGAFFPATAAATAEVRAELCAAIFARARHDDLWSAGYAATASSGITVANTNGAHASFDGSEAAVNVKMNATDSSGFAESYHADVAQIDAAACADRSARKATASAHPRDVEPGAWTVILEPAAFGELLHYLSDHFSAQSYDEGSSFVSNALGERLLGENVTISDDFTHPLAPGMPFDYEGAPTSRIALIDRGLANAVATDSYWAHRLQRENTGHALPAPNPYGPQPRHLVVSPGTRTTAELIRDTKRGLLISRFWYIRVVDQKQAIVTGMTRDGTFLVEDGAIAGGVRNLRFNESIVTALRRCEFASELTRSGGFDYSMVVPAAKIEGFRFTSATTF